ncbi:MAG: tetratricopeptide repeat protein [Thermoanaerobaculia bacterium]
MTRRNFTILLLVAAIGIAGCASPEARRQESLGAADAAVARGDLERAVEILRLARAYDPRDRLIATRLGQLHEDLGNVDQALRLVETFPDEVQEVQWLNLRARLLFRCGRYKEAARIAGVLEQMAVIEARTIETLSDIVVVRKLIPSRIGTLSDAWAFMLVERLLDRGDPVTALFWMEQLSGDDPAIDRFLQSFMEHALESDDLGFVRRIDRLIGPADSAMETLVHRRSLVLTGKKAEVARLDARFLVRYPDHPQRGEILVAEARRRLSRGEAEEALRLVGAALYLDGSDIPALILRGLALEWSGRTEEAEMAFRTALALDPNNRMAREALRSTLEEPGALIMRIESRQP